MTPEEYFEQNPDVAVLVQQPDGFDFHLELTGKALDGFRRTWIDIDWTGYTRRIAYNPHFAWGERREVEWTGKTQNFWAAMSENETRRQLFTAEGDPLNIWEIGRYVDAPADLVESPDEKLIADRDYWEELATELAEAVGKHLGIDVGEHSSSNCPVRRALWEIKDAPDVRDNRRKHLDAIEDAPAEKPAPELSRFLPEGWEWGSDNHGERCVTYTGPVSGNVYLYEEHSKETWHSLGLLHPSEGGGFQRHTPGDPMPCDGELVVDVPGLNEIVTYKANEFYWAPDSKYAAVTAWRPHFEKGGAQ